MKDQNFQSSSETGTLKYKRSGVKSLKELWLIRLACSLKRPVQNCRFEMCRSEEEQEDSFSELRESMEIFHKTLFFQQMRISALKFDVPHFSGTLLQRKAHIPLS